MDRATGVGITVVMADRTTQKGAILLNLNQLGIAVRRPVIGGSEEEEVVFYPWVHVYQLGPLIEERTARDPIERVCKEPGLGKFTP